MVYLLLLIAWWFSMAMLKNQRVNRHIFQLSVQNGPLPSVCLQRWVSPRVCPLSSVNIAMERMECRTQWLWHGGHAIFMIFLSISICFIYFYIFLVAWDAVFLGGGRFLTSIFVGDIRRKSGKRTVQGVPEIGEMVSNIFSFRCHERNLGRSTGNPWYFVETTMGSPTFFWKCHVFGHENSRCRPCISVKPWQMPPLTS